MFNKDPIYINEIEKVSSLNIEWDRFANKTFFIAGASGLIGTFFVDALMRINAIYNLHIKIYAIGRNEENAHSRFKDYLRSEHFSFIKHDVNAHFDNLEIHCDYIIHGASNTHPLAYASDPIGTITSNVIGTQNILEFAARQKDPRVMFLSSVEIYGENRGDIEKFDEDYCGYIDCNTLRAGYPESKRLGEALCQAHIQAKKIDIVIPRLSRVYGSTMSQGDSKAIAQFIKKAVKKENIVLKSNGEQLYSYTHVADVATAFLYIMLYGRCGEAYNVSADNSDITLKDLSEILARISGAKVVYDLPDKIEAIGYSKATKALLDNSKLKKLGWTSIYDIKKGLEETVKTLASEEIRL